MLMGVETEIAPTEWEEKAARKPPSAIEDGPEVRNTMFRTGGQIVANLIIVTVR